jgi:hypothetical protein
MAMSDHVGRDEAHNPTSRRNADATIARQWTAWLLRHSRLTPVGNDNLDGAPHRVAPLSFDSEAAVELECLRDMLPPELLDAARRRSKKLGIGADQVLISRGVIDEEAYLGRLALHLGIRREGFAEVARRDVDLSDQQIRFAAEHGIVPLRQNGELTWVLALRSLTARELCQRVARDPAQRRRTRLASTHSMHRFLLQQGGEALAEQATGDLKRRHPTLSAAPVAPSRGRWRQRLTRAAGVATVLALPPLLAPQVWSVVLAVWFLAFVGYRLAASCWPRRPIPARPRLPEDGLPHYTVIAALHREASSVGPLLQAIAALDYPREKLDVILVIEPDDPETRDAIAKLAPRPQLQVLIAPAVAPQTKPKALNCALPFVRGSFVAVYDAEDRPDPGQLRAALAAFDWHGADVGCAQASLCIDNVTHSWLSRMFAAEYAGQFDVVLPGLVALGLPLPLGGSSNHFRTAVLREVGAWDPYNVTEDADLGFRLARFGYRSVTFVSTTDEEAPIRFDGWLRQRTRWMKGWIQTWSVHMRRPRQFCREGGFGALGSLNLTVGGNVLTALAHPVMLCELLRSVPALAAAPDWSVQDGLTSLFAVTIAAGYGSSIAIGLHGLAARDRLRDGWVLALTPLYWICLSIAAWRAVAQYVWNPYRWEKTEHGLADRTSTGATQR